MLKSEAIQKLQESIAQDGDTNMGWRATVALLHPERLREFDAREQIVRNIVRAKRDIRAPMRSDFFKDVWPDAAEALKKAAAR